MAVDSARHPSITTISTALAVRISPRAVADLRQARRPCLISVSSSGYKNEAQSPRLQTLPHFLRPSSSAAFASFSPARLVCRLCLSRCLRQHLLVCRPCLRPHFSALLRPCALSCHPDSCTESSHWTGLYDCNLSCFSYAYHPVCRDRAGEGGGSGQCLEENNPANTRPKKKRHGVPVNLKENNQVNTQPKKKQHPLITKGFSMGQRLGGDRTAQLKTPLPSQGRRRDGAAALQPCRITSSTGPVTLTC